ncbi:arabinofuranosidase [Coprinopsis sp. MPI-PUGE-AT-0042]|nr:arabinofuranosidase [Coprinopsis sp. MPI-PUGE-AT-0042]
MIRPLSILCTLAPLLTLTSAVKVTVQAKASHKIPSTLWGLMYEDISWSGDGGLYGELLQNRAFQLQTAGTSEALRGWKAVNNASVSVIKDTSPVSSRLPNALHLAVPAGKTGPVGFANTGYEGFKVTEGTTYKASFYYRFPTASSFSGSITVELQTSSGQVLGSALVPASASKTNWNQVTFDLPATASGPATDNQFAVTVDAMELSGQSIHFAMFSLFPPTFRDRANGMRKDLAEALYELKPSFFRFPGGNNLEGQTVDRRWQWNATVGPLEERPGRFGDWSYVNTDGLGILEYLYWCEDIEAEPIMGVYSGFSLGGYSVPEDQLQPYIQQAIDQINFVIGDPSKSAAAALRKSLGREEPFPVRYVEIGNEDFLAPRTYIYRWRAFIEALEKEFPQLNFLATTLAWNPVLEPTPKYYDLHVYQTPTWFSDNAFYYDDFARNGTLYFEGEYAAISTNASDIYGRPENGRLIYPTMISAASEAAFMSGLERNSDIVFAAAYAPLIGHATRNQWTPNLLAFDAGSVYRSTSYYVQKFFSLYRGDEYLPSTLPERKGKLHWTVVRNTSTRQVIIKAINVGAIANAITFELPFNTVANTGTAEVLSGNETDSNTPSNPNKIVPKKINIPTGKAFDYTAPAYSVSVLVVEAY